MHLGDGAGGLFAGRSLGGGRTSAIDRRRLDGFRKGRRSTFHARFLTRGMRRLRAEAVGLSQWPPRHRIHSLYLRINRDPQGRPHHALECGSLRAMGDQLLWHQPVGPDLWSSAPALRSVGVRYLRRICGRSPTPSGAARPEPPPQPTGSLHFHLRADPVVLRPIAPHLHGQIRRRSPHRLPDVETPSLVWGGAADTRPHVLDEAPPRRALYEPVRSHRGHNRQQLLHGP